MVGGGIEETRCEKGGRGGKIGSAVPKEEIKVWIFRGTKKEIQNEGEEVRERMSDKGKVNLERDFLLGPWASLFFTRKEVPGTSDGSGNTIVLLLTGVFWAVPGT